MPTARDIIQDALETIRVYNPGESFNPPDGARGLSVLNDMLDSLSNESLSCFTYLRQGFPLVINQSAYTVGPGGDIDGPRPLRVNDAAGSAYILDQNNNRYPMDVVDQIKWNLRTTAAVNSNLPDTLLYEPNMPLGTIRVWPTPSEVYNVYFFSYAQLTDFTTLDTTVDFPPGYKLMLTTNLAVALKPYFKDAVLDPIVAVRAAESKGNIKRTNMRTQSSIFEPEIVARGQSTYNIRSDRNYAISQRHFTSLVKRVNRRLAFFDDLITKNAV